jgi:hypothetical protein
VINTHEILNKDFERHIKALVRKYPDKYKEIYGSLCDVEWHRYNKSRFHIGKIAYSWHSAAKLLASLSGEPFADYYECGLEGNVPSFVSEFLNKRGWNYIRHDILDILEYHPKTHDEEL